MLVNDPAVRAACSVSHCASPGVVAGLTENQKRPVSPMGQAGRMEATLQKMGIGGCGLAAPSIDEGEPGLVRRALLIMP